MKPSKKIAIKLAVALGACALLAPLPSRAQTVPEADAPTPPSTVQAGEAVHAGLLPEKQTERERKKQKLLELFDAEKLGDAQDRLRFNNLLDELTSLKTAAAPLTSPASPLQTAPSTLDVEKGAAASTFSTSSIPSNSPASSASPAQPAPTPSTPATSASVPPAPPAQPTPFQQDRHLRLLQAALPQVVKWLAEHSETKAVGGWSLEGKVLYSAEFRTGLPEDEQPGQADLPVEESLRRNGDVLVITFGPEDRSAKGGGLELWLDSFEGKLLRFAAHPEPPPWRVWSGNTVVVLLALVALLLAVNGAVLFWRCFAARPEPKPAEQSGEGGEEPRSGEGDPY